MSPEWLTALTALVVAVAGCVAWAGRWAWRLLRRTGHFLDDWTGEPARDGLEATPGVMARLASVEHLLAKVVAETTPNGGGSMRDVVARTAHDVTDIRDEQVSMRTWMAQIELDRARREGKLWQIGRTCASPGARGARLAACSRSRWSWAAGTCGCRGT